MVEYMLYGGHLHINDTAVNETGNDFTPMKSTQCRSDFNNKYIIHNILD